MNSARNDTVLERSKSLYYNQKWHDLEFHCTDEATGVNKLFLAHRLVLASCSPVFEALCYGPLAEEGIIRVTDVDATAFDAMLQYMYTDTIHYKLSPVLACNLLYVAKKYLFESLEHFARKYLIHTIRDSNCFEIHNLAMSLDETNLVNASFEYICRRMEHVKKNLNGENLTKELMVKLVSCEKINCSESTLADLAVLFGKRSCEEDGIEDNAANVGKVLRLENIIQNIRWHLLRPDELSPFLTELKNQDDISTTNMLREKLPGKLAVVQRYSVDPICHRQILNENQLTVVTSVKVNKSVMLTGIFVNARNDLNRWNVQEKQRYNEHMTIDILNETGKIAHIENFANEVEFGSPFLVTLQDQIAVPENTYVNIRIRLPRPYFNYPFGTYSDYCKIPSGLTVTCEQFADFPGQGVLHSAPDLSVITGFQFLC